MQQSPWFESKGSIWNYFSSLNFAVFQVYILTVDFDISICIMLWFQMVVVQHAWRFLAWLLKSFSVELLYCSFLPYYHLLPQDPRYNGRCWKTIGKAFLCSIQSNEKVKKKRNEDCGGLFATRTILSCHLRSVKHRNPVWIIWIN